MRKINLSLFAITFLTIPCYAASNYYCAASHQYINIGDSADQVKAACGTPTQIQQAKPGTPVPNQPEVWVYPVIKSTMSQPTVNNYYQNNAGQLRASFYRQDMNGSDNLATFNLTIQDGKVSSISGTPSCGSWNPYVGASTQALLNRCGQPITTQPATDGNNPYTTKIETWIYNNPYGQALQLQFVNGKLVKIQ